MFNVCFQCGEYRVDKKIRKEQIISYAECPICLYKQPFKQLPLFCLSGTNGVGKTTVALELTHHLTECIVLDMDILWDDKFNTPEDQYLAFKEFWLRTIKNINQNGKPVLMCGSSIPGGFDNCLEARYFSSFHFAALICDDEILTKRLKARPAWRKGSSESYLHDQIQFNHWFKTNHLITNPPIYLIDNTALTVDDTVHKVIHWIKNHFNT